MPFALEVARSLAASVNCPGSVAAGGSAVKGCWWPQAEFDGGHVPWNTMTLWHPGVRRSRWRDCPRVSR